MKKLLITMLTAALAVLIIEDQNVTYATENETEESRDSKLHQTGSSDAKIQFSAPTNEIVAPVNPNDTNKPLEATHNHDGNETGFVGPLSLNYVSNFDFSKAKVSSSTETYKSISLSPFIQVSDLRGTGAGWSVTAKMKGFVNKDGAESLQGSYITLNNTTAKGVSNDKENKQPEITEKIILNNDTVLVANAATKTGNVVNTAQGLGTWVIGWLTEDDNENDNVTLTVPGAMASIGEHSAEIDWMLTDGPKTTTSPVATDK